MSSHVEEILKSGNKPDVFKFEYRTIIRARILARNGDIEIDLTTDVSGLDPKTVVNIVNEIYSIGDNLINELNANNIDKAVWGGSVINQ